ncbi:hypothetical protein QFZ37_002742 [Chryseobacterium ginsenosidimutans]|nr:hypothetical protein [Chryseobacterium ginsenosidimutans]
MQIRYVNQASSFSKKHKLLINIRIFNSVHLILLGDITRLRFVKNGSIGEIKRLGLNKKELKF